MAFQFSNKIIRGSLIITNGRAIFIVERKKELGLTKTLPVYCKMIMQKKKIDTILIDSICQESAYLFMCLYNYIIHLSPSKSGFEREEKISPFRFIHCF